MVQYEHVALWMIDTRKRGEEIDKNHRYHNDLFITNRKLYGYELKW